MNVHSQYFILKIYHSHSLRDIAYSLDTQKFHFLTILDSMQTGNLGSLPLIMFQQYVKNAVVLLELWMFVMKKGWHMHLSLAVRQTNLAHL